MTKLMFACVATLALTACPNKRAGEADKAISKLTELKDKMCACKTGACAKGVTDEETAWAKAEVETRGSNAPKLSEVETKKLSDLNEEIAKCQLDVAKAETQPAPIVPEATGSTTK